MGVDIFSPSALDHVVGVDEFGTYYFDDGSYHNYGSSGYPWTYSRLQAEIPANLPPEAQTELATTFPQGYGGVLFGPGGVLIPSLTAGETYADRETQLQILKIRAEALAKENPHATVIAPGGAVIAPKQIETDTVKTAMNQEANRNAILARSGGNGYYTFDEWNWFYLQATGTPGPAPEDVGLARDANGAVKINGQEYIDYDTWASYALKTGKQEEKKESPSKPVASFLEWIRKFLVWIVSGKR